MGLGETQRPEALHWGFDVRLQARPRCLDSLVLQIPPAEFLSAAENQKVR